MTGIIFCIVDSKGPAHDYREGRRGPQHPQRSHSPTQITPSSGRTRKKVMELSKTSQINNVT